MERTVRLKSITIENFKNVLKGTVDFGDRHKDYQSSVLGLYGQNGSGKTALIDSVKMLKLALSGERLPNDYADYIYVDAESATLKFELSVDYPESNYNVWYQFSIRKTPSEHVYEDDGENDEYTEKKVEIFNEVLSFSYSSEKEKIRKNQLINTGGSELFLPKSKMIELVGDDKENRMDLLVAKKMAQATSRSFVFSRELIEQCRRKCKKNIYIRLLTDLISFARRELFVVETKSSGLVNLNELPLAFKYRNNKTETVGEMLISLTGLTRIPEKHYSLVNQIIENMNIVLEQLVPGLQIGIVDLGTVVMKNGKTGKQVQVVSLKDNKKIPFCCESDGIKKIVAVLQLLIVIYNHPSVTVAIDELDSGIFEYLLGELLKIISEKGKGQLIFTSHNLRPLETIDKGFIAFTTTNPEERYTRLTNVKGTNNLRDFYYRDIVLGGEREQLYNQTNNYEISFAFREAGEMIGL